jgi:hypothetical protein
VGTVEFVGKYLHFLSAPRTFAEEGLEVFELLKSRAVLGCVGHESTSLLVEK